MIRRFLSTLACVSLSTIALLMTTPGCQSSVVGQQCVPNTSEACYSGSADTLGIGTCKAGAQTCNADGLGYGPCLGEVLPGVEICGADSNCDGQSNLCTGNTLNARFFYAQPDNTGYEGYRIVRDVALDALGNVVFSVEFAVGMELGGPFGSFEAPSSDYSTGFLKLNPAFDTIFATQVHGRAGHSSVGSDDAGNTFGVFQFESAISFAGESFSPQGLAPGNALMFSLDPAGQLGDRKQLFCNGDVRPYGLEANPSGDVLLAGYSFASLDLGGGPLEYVLLGRFDASGNHVFSKQLSSAAGWGYDVHFDAHGDIVLNGLIYGDANFGGGPILTNTDDFVVAKLNSAGQHLWTRRFIPAPNVAEPYIFGQVATDAQGNVYAAGGFVGTFDFGAGNISSDAGAQMFLVKLNSQGGYEWGKFLGGGAAARWARAIAVDASGNVVVGAKFDTSIDFGAGPITVLQPGIPAAAVAKFTSDGELLWTRQFDGIGAGMEFADRGGITIAPSGEILLLGQVWGDTHFGAAQSPGENLQGSVFVVRLAP